MTTTEYVPVEVNGVMYLKPKYKMMSPVRCSFCGEVYSLTKTGELIARHADADVFMTPCCDRLASTTLHTTDFTRL